MTIDTTTDHLRQRFIEDMTASQRGPASQKSHLRAYDRFSSWLQRSPDTATPDEIRQFQCTWPSPASASSSATPP